MKKRLLVLAFLVVMFSCFSLVAGCNNKDEGNKVIPDVPEVSTVQMLLSKATVTLEKREEIVLTAKIDDVAVDGVSWRSSNESVATVSNGKVVAVAEGNAVIIATYENSEARCPITVTDHGLIPGITTNLTSKTLYLLANDYFDLTYFVTYNGKKLDDATVTVDLVCEDQSVSFENNKITALKTSTEPAILSLRGDWHGMEFSSTFEVMVVGNLTAKLSDQMSVNLFNDERGGENTLKFTPKFMVDDEEVLANDYTIIDWEYDEKIVEIDESTKTVKGLSKGSSKVIATFKENQSGATVQAEITVNVDIYSEDKSEIVLDTLYLNQDQFLLKRNEIYGDLSESALEGWTINTVIDVTETTHYPIAVGEELENGNAVINISSVKALGVTGDRKWQIDCDKYSYIVTVPIVEKHGAKDLAGTYSSSEWEYSVKISFVENKDKIEFIDENGNVIETGTFTVTEWKSKDSGILRITTDGTAICNKQVIECFYYVSNGVRQLNLFLNGSYGDAWAYKVVYNGQRNNEDLPEESISGEYKSDEFVYSLILGENSTCSFKSAIAGEISGTYHVNGNNITLSFVKAVNGQTIFEGVISGTNIILDIDGSWAKTFKKVFNSDEGQSVGPDNAKFSGVYRANDRPWIKLDEDGTFVFAFPHYNYEISTTGTYTLRDGVITVNLNAGWYNQGTFTGTYYEQNGKLIIEIKIVYDSKYELVK